MSQEFTTMYNLLKSMRVKEFVVQGVQSSAQSLELRPVASPSQDVGVEDEDDKELRRKIAEVDTALEENVQRAHDQAEEEIRSIRERTAWEIAGLQEDAAAEKAALSKVLKGKMRSS